MFMLPRRRGLELSTLDGSLRRYLEVNPQLLERRRHYPLIRVLEFLKNDLGVGSIDDLLKCDVRSLAISLQKWVNRRVQETSRKTDGFEVYLARSFLSFYDVEIPPRKVRIPRKAVKSRVDRIPSLAEIQKLVTGTRSLRMRLAIMTLALTGMRLGECLRVRREHVDLERGVIVIPPENSKTGRGREVPIPGELKTLLQLYFEKYFPHDRGYIFCVENNHKKPMPTSRFYEMYHSLLARLGLDQKTPDGSAYILHPHVFRKWYRTTLESAGVNKLLIDLWIGAQLRRREALLPATARDNKAGVREGGRGAG
jgi:integrase